MNVASVNAGRLTLEDTQTTLEANHQAARPHHPRVCHTCRSRNRDFTNVALADHPGRPTLPVPARLAPPSLLHPPARIHGRPPQPRRLDRCVVAVQRRLPILGFDVPVGRRDRGGVAVVVPGADLSGVQGVAARRPVMGRMGHGRQLRPQVTT